jgi:hypothetical protein
VTPDENYGHRGRAFRVGGGVGPDLDRLATEPVLARGWLEGEGNSGFAPGWSGWQARHGVQPACLASPSVIRFTSSSPMKRMRMHCTL